jgi:CRISPR-associated protein Cst1
LETINITMGDFLKNAGIVGLKYLLDLSEADENIDYGISEDEQSLWIDKEFAQNADWTDMYFKALIEYYEPYTAYATVIQKIDDLIIVINKGKWKPEDVKDDLKYINDKLLSNSYKSGFENIRDKIEHPEVYELLMANKLKEKMQTDELLDRLKSLKNFLNQPLCEETFSMKSIIYNFVNRFWSEKSFLLRANAKKDMRDVFEADFSKPLRAYLLANHNKSKDLCIDCNMPMDSKEKVSIAFMNEQADDLVRKRSSFWKFNVDAYLCPMCAYIYALAPLGFQLIGNNFMFMNVNCNMVELLKCNRKDNNIGLETEKKDEEKYSVWLAKTMDILLEEKTKELGNIQVIVRGRNAEDRYVFSIINKELLDIFCDDKIKKVLNNLSKHPFVKVEDEFINVHEKVIMNILNYRNQYSLLNMLLKNALDVKETIITAWFVYEVQFRSMSIKNGDKGGKIMNRYSMRESGYELRKNLLDAKGTTDDECLRGMIYQLLNALSVKNIEHFMDIIMRVYCSTKLQVPDGFIRMLDNNKDNKVFQEYGYAFVLGLQGSHYVEGGADNE